MSSIFKFKQREGSIYIDNWICSFLIQVKSQEFVTFQGFKVAQLRTLFWDTVYCHWVFAAQCFETVVASLSLYHQPLKMRPHMGLKCRATNTSDRAQYPTKTEFLNGYNEHLKLT